MGIILLLVILVLLFGGGGVYMGGPHLYGRRRYRPDPDRRPLGAALAVKTVRRFTPLGRLIIGGAVIAVAAVAACTLIMVPSPFGF